MPVAIRLAVMPRALVLFITLMLLAALGAAAIAVGASLTPPKVPPPTGPAANGLVAYDSAGDIWVVNPDASDAHQLTTSPALEHGPAWSADGTRLVFWSQDAQGAPSRLVVVRADGSNPVTIATNDAGRTSYWAPEWSPDGRYVAYSLGEPGDSPQADERIYVAATDGSGAAQVGDPTLVGRKPVWSPDSTALAFAGNREPVDAPNPGGVECCYPEQGVYLMAVDGSDLRRLTQVENEEQYEFYRSEFSPDGNWIATTVNGQVWIVAADRSTESVVTPGPTSGALVSRWSPDGQRIAFVDGDVNHVRVIPAAGGVYEDLGPSNGGFTWSPDGTSVAILSSVTLLGRPGPLTVVDSATGDVLATIDGVDNAYPAGVHYPSWQRLALP